VAEREHLDERGHLAGVAEVVLERPGGECRTGGRLDGEELDVLPTLGLVGDEGIGEARVVRAAADAPDDDVGRVLRFLHLQLRFLTDHRLVEQNVVQHAAERVLRVGILRRRLDRLRDRDAERAG
jgi:hypothetical protein